MIWQVKFTDQARKELRSLDHETQRRIMKYLRERIETIEDPRRFGKALVGDKSGLWRYRINDYRVVCLIQDDKFIVLALRIDHRKKVYDD